jgi:cell division protein FtsL
MRNVSTAAARRLDVSEREERRQRPARRPLRVVEGDGLDARAREGVDVRFLSRVKVAVVVALAFVLLGAVRVTLCAQTVTLLEGNAATRAQIKDAQALESDLKVQRSVLSSNSRITRIATQNLGMVLATDTLVVNLSDPVDEAKVSTPVEGADEASEVDGEAEQSADEQSSASPLA